MEYKEQKLIYKKELIERIKELKQEIQFRESRLEYNRLAGVCNKSIKSQKITIFNLKLKQDSYNYKLEHDLNTKIN